MPDSAVTTNETSELRRLNQLYATVMQYVQDQHLLRPAEPEWTLKDADFGPRVAKRLHRLYASEKNELLARVGLATGLVFCISFARMPPPINAPAAVVSFLILCLPLILYSTVGAYWTLYELSVNRRLGWRIRTIVILLIVLVLLEWLKRGAPRFWYTPLPEEILFQQGIAAARQSQRYLLTSALLVYIPAISYFTFLALRTLSACWVAAIGAVRWLSRVSSLEQADHLEQLASATLHLSDSDEPTSLLRMELRHLEALLEWAKWRREVIQDRLILTTVILAFLGVVANTSLAEKFIQLLAKTYRQIFSADSALGERYIAYMLLAFVIVVAGVFVSRIARLLSEAYVTDFVAQACLLARQSRVISGQDHVAGPDATLPRPRRRAWWERLLNRR